MKCSSHSVCTIIAPEINHFKMEISGKTSGQIEVFFFFLLFKVVWNM